MRGALLLPTGFATLINCSCAPAWPSVNMQVDIVHGAEQFDPVLSDRLPVVRKCLVISLVQCGSYWPPVATEHLRYGYGDCGTDF